MLLAALLTGLVCGDSSAEASIPREEPRGVLLEQPVPLLEQSPLLEVPADESTDTAATGGESLPLFGPGPGPEGLFDGVRIPAVERFQAETRYRVIELEIEIRAELEKLQTFERAGFALFGGGKSRRGSPNRYYDPELGRFISADPLGYVDGPSMYGFASNSPVNYTDPLGLNPWDCKVEGEGACELLQEALAYFATIREQERQEQLAQERVEVAEVLAQAGPEKGMRPHARTALSRFFQSKGLSLEATVEKINSYLGPAGSCPEAVDQLGCELGGGVNALIQPYTMLYTQLVGELLGGLAVPESTLHSYLTSPARAVPRATTLADDAFTHGYSYHPRIRARGLQDPRAHNFPYSVDDVILRETPVRQTDGSLLYRKPGTLNDTEGVYEIAVNPETGTIFHRTFKGN